MRIFLLATIFVSVGQLSCQHCLALTNTPVYTDTVYGDLDADMVYEMIVHYEFADPVILEGDPEVLAQVVVYRWEREQWEEWPAARGAILYAFDEVGFAQISVYEERGALVVNHTGTGSFSNVYTRRFRWQNERFELIGVTMTEYERCEYEQTLDYNLSTGNFTFKDVWISCAGNETKLRTTTRQGRAQRYAPLLLSEFENNTHSVEVRGVGAEYF